MRVPYCNPPPPKISHKGSAGLIKVSFIVTVTLVEVASLLNSIIEVVTLVEGVTRALHVDGLTYSAVEGVTSL